MKKSGDFPYNNRKVCKACRTAGRMELREKKAAREAEAKIVKLDLVNPWCDIGASERPDWIAGKSRREKLLSFDPGVK
jgi:hypothetical protein